MKLSQQKGSNESQAQEITGMSLDLENLKNVCLKKLSIQDDSLEIFGFQMSVAQKWCQFDQSKNVFGSSSYFQFQ